MADNVTEEEEPSIEEILDSIRQIISEDDEDAAEDEVVTAEEDSVEEVSIPAEVDSVSEVEEEAVAAEPEPEPEPEATPESVEDDIIDLVDKVEDPVEDEPEPESIPEPEVTPEPEPEIDMSDDFSVGEDEPVEDVSFSDAIADAAEESILTQNAESATLGGFETLVKKTSIERNGGITVEDIVRSELKPMLRDWLDAHLPVIIERLVQEELEKLSKRALED